MGVSLSAGAERVRGTLTQAIAALGSGLPPLAYTPAYTSFTAFYRFYRSFLASCRGGLTYTELNWVRFRLLQPNQKAFSPWLSLTYRL